jgi:hypothetical protein
MSKMINVIDDKVFPKEFWELDYEFSIFYFLYV